MKASQFGVIASSLHTSLGGLPHVKDRRARYQPLWAEQL